jgi:hypothetical protein
MTTQTEITQRSQHRAVRFFLGLLAGSTLRFESLGPQQLKGIPDDTEVFRVSCA